MQPSEKVRILANAVRLAERILSLQDEPEYGITAEERLEAAMDVLNTGVARSEGADCTVCSRTHKVLHRAVTDIEVRILYDRLGLKTWRPA